MDSHRTTRLRGALPSPAMVVACIALAISLTSAGYAAFVLPPKSVGAKHLKKNAVNGSKVRDNSLSGADVNEAKLGPVPRAATATTAESAKTADQAAAAATAGTASTAESAKTAEKATTATTADTATTATRADTATTATRADTATTATRADAATSATSATDAANADLLDNLNSSEFLRIGVLDAFHYGGALPAAPAASGVAVGTLNLTLQRASRLFVMGRIDGTVYCYAAGPCSSTYAVFVDGVLVPNSQSLLSAAAGSSTRDRIELRGVTSTLAAGAHVVSIRDLAGPNVSSRGWQERTVSAIAVG